MIPRFFSFSACVTEYTNRRSTTRDFSHISEQEKHARIQSPAASKKSSRNNGSEQGNAFKFRLPKRKLWLYYLWACALCTTLDFTARLFISKEKNEKSLISKRETVWGGVRPTSTHAPDGVEKRRGNEVALSGNLGHEAGQHHLEQHPPAPVSPKNYVEKL